LATSSETYSKSNREKRRADMARIVSDRRRVVGGPTTEADAGIAGRGSIA
jgi:hypothetical protein